jgi:hypothetical protein
LLGIILMILALVGFACCVAGVAGVWKLRADVSGQIDTHFDRLDEGVEQALAATDRVRHSVHTIREQVNFLEKGPDEYYRGWEWDKTVSAYLRNAVNRIELFAQTANTVAALQRGIDELPLGKISHVEFEDPDRAAKRAAEIAATLKKLQTTVGDPSKDLYENEVLAEAEEVDRVLQMCDETIDTWQADLNAVRADLPGMKTRILDCLTLAAVLVTIACAWAGLGQISLFGHGWKWLAGKKRADGNPPSA